MYFCVLRIVCFLSFYVLFLCICVQNNCHRVATQLQLTNIYIYIYIYIYIIYFRFNCFCFQHDACVSFDTQNKLKLF